MFQKITHSIYYKPLTVIMALFIIWTSYSFKTRNAVVLTAGTSVVLETVSMISSELVSVGQLIDFRVKYDVNVDGKTVIEAGSIAKGQVMRAQSAKGLGKEGFLEIQIKSVSAVDGQEVFLSGGNVYQEGEDKTALSVVLGLFVCILFLLMKGENAEVPPGYQVSSGVATTMTIDI